MAKKKRNLKKIKRNEGFSLIELIVTILISSCVVIAATGFLILGLRQYQTTEEETVLQRESQVTELFLTELFQEASDFEVLEGVGLAGGEVTKAVAVKRDSTEYLVVHAGSELWYGEAVGGSREEQLMALLHTPKSEKFLADYVTSFQLFGTGSTFAEIEEQDGWLSIKVEFSMTKKQYTSNMVVALRNTKRN
ncbi:MAG: prepilin-type N-terminal cleavage/methylation domain-containing protein [Lachnospiraceae bacterium]|nr:prepilin-type N-terminal cleavage/methylation domain-containing protein [Lachnospiraceae bacterium]